MRCVPADSITVQRYDYPMISRTSSTVTFETMPAGRVPMVIRPHCAHHDEHRFQLGSACRVAADSRSSRPL
jgi:hypothetical protein